MKVEVWSDVVCPWCHVGAARFNEALRRLGWGASDVEVIYRPFELDPTVPPGGIELTQYLRHKFGTGATLEQIEGRVAQAGAELGITFDWSNVLRVNTFDAHRLLEWALALHGSAVQARLKRRLMKAYFEEGSNVADASTLALLSGEVGLDTEEAAEVLASDAYGEAVRAGEQEARALEIHAVPTFVIERRVTIPGAQDPETFVALLARVRSRLAQEDTSGELATPD